MKRFSKITKLADIKQTHYKVHDIKYELEFILIETKIIKINCSSQNNVLFFQNIKIENLMKII